MTSRFSADLWTTSCQVSSQTGQIDGWTKARCQVPSPTIVTHRESTSPLLIFLFISNIILFSYWHSWRGIFFNNFFYLKKKPVPLTVNFSNSLPKSLSAQMCMVTAKTFSTRVFSFQGLRSRVQDGCALTGHNFCTRVFFLGFTVVQGFRVEGLRVFFRLHANWTVQIWTQHAYEPPQCFLNYKSECSNYFILLRDKERVRVYLLCNNGSYNWSSSAMIQEMPISQLISETEICSSKPCCRSSQQPG